MKRAARLGFRFGCLISVVAPIVAIVLYPRAKWLFAFALVGVAIFMLEHLTIKDPTPQALADEMHRLLTGTIGGWDVEEFEHKRIRDPQLHELWRRSLDVRRAPEEWVRMDEDHKQQIREIIRSLRELGEVRAAMKQSSPSPPEAN